MPRPIAARRRISRRANRSLLRRLPRQGKRAAIGHTARSRVGRGSDQPSRKLTARGGRSRAGVQRSGSPPVERVRQERHEPRATQPQSPPRTVPPGAGTRHPPLSPEALDAIVELAFEPERKRRGRRPAKQGQPAEDPPMDGASAEADANGEAPATETAAEATAEEALAHAALAAVAANGLVGELEELAAAAATDGDGMEPVEASAAAVAAPTAGATPLAPEPLEASAPGAMAAVADVPVQAVASLPESPDLLPVEAFWSEYGSDPYDLPTGWPAMSEDCDVNRIADELDRLVGVQRKQAKAHRALTLDAALTAQEIELLLRDQHSWGLAVQVLRAELPEVADVPWQGQFYSEGPVSLADAEAAGLFPEEAMAAEPETVEQPTAEPQQAEGADAVTASGDTDSPVNPAADEQTAVEDAETVDTPAGSAAAPPDSAPEAGETPEVSAADADPAAAPVAEAEAMQSADQDAPVAAVAAQEQQAPTAQAALQDVQDAPTDEPEGSAEDAATHDPAAATGPLAAAEQEPEPDAEPAGGAGLEAEVASAEESGIEATEEEQPEDVLLAAAPEPAPAPAPENGEPPTPAPGEDDPTADVEVIGAAEQAALANEFQEESGSSLETALEQISHRVTELVQPLEGLAPSVEGIRQRVEANAAATVALASTVERIQHHAEHSAPTDVVRAPQSPPTAVAATTASDPTGAMLAGLGLVAASWGVTFYVKTGSLALSLGGLVVANLLGCALLWRRRLSPGAPGSPG